jgi:hypothetical protein
MALEAANMAKRLDTAGADGLVLFNRFYQPDIDLDELEIRPNVLLNPPPALCLPLSAKSTVRIVMPLSERNTCEQ